jgi:hypothetical protein
LFCNRGPNLKGLGGLGQESIDVSMKIFPAATPCQRH